jgi:hypothetical protein
VEFLVGILRFTHEVKLPPVTSPHGSNLLKALNIGYFSLGCVSVVLAKHVVRTMRFQIESPAKADAIVLRVKVEALPFPRDRGAWMVVTVFAIAWRIGVWVVLLIPAVERVSERYKSSLTRL